MFSCPSSCGKNKLRKIAHLSRVRMLTMISPTHAVADYAWPVCSPPEPGGLPKQRANPVHNGRGNATAREIVLSFHQGASVSGERAPNYKPTLPYDRIF